MGEPIAEVGYLAGMCAWDGDSWEKASIDSSGNTEVAIANWPGTPTIYNVTMTAANTEYSQALPANTRKFTVKCRGEYAVKICFTATESGTKYLTIPSLQSYWEDQINDASITLYFQCATDGQVLEVVAWA